VLKSYNKSIGRALLDLFPDIGLEESKFTLNRIWRDANTRRTFFEECARENHFDPLVAKNWYSQSLREIILAKKGARRVLGYHENSVKTALLELFPEIGLQASEFCLESKWGNDLNRKKFFENYAKKRAFNPLHAKKWYTQPINKMTLKNEEALHVASYHGNSLVQALVDLFPGIGLDPSKFVRKETNSYERTTTYRQQVKRAVQTYQLIDFEDKRVAAE